MYYKLATVAAEWWIEQMKKKCKKLYPDKFSFERSGLIIKDSSLQEQFSQFKEFLIEEIYNTLTNYSYISLGCYYYPDRTLMTLAKKCNISTTYFPIHAHIEIVNNSIMVSDNHDEPYKLRIYSQ